MSLLPLRYLVERTSLTGWRVDGLPCDGIDGAIAACRDREEASGSPWGPDRPGHAATAAILDTLRIGETTTMLVPPIPAAGPEAP